MSIVEINWRPSGRQLRQFGCIALVALPLVGWLWGAGAAVLAVLGGCGLVLAALGFAAPSLLRPLFVGLSLITMPIGLVVGELTMAIVYFGVFAPIALLFRLTGRDVLQRRLQLGQASYWEAKRGPANMSGYYRQS